MKIAQLKGLSDPNTAAKGIRSTAGQDTSVTSTHTAWYKKRWVYVSAIGAILLIVLFAWAARGWLRSSHTVQADRLRIAEVQRAHFVRDVAAQGTVIAAVNPTLFSVATGTITYNVRAGDPVKKGQVIATLDSPELSNEFHREKATLDGLNAALDRQEIEIRRSMLQSQQQADLAQVAIQAAERELKRAQWAWDQHAISERDYKHAQDDVATAKLNFEQARDNTGLERDSLKLAFRTRKLDRDRQALVVDSLQRRVNELNIQSPVDGMVANLAQPQKTKVAESVPLITVVALTAIENEYQVAETYAGEIKPGMGAEITLEGRKHLGLVTAISPEVRQNQVTVRVKFAKEQPPGLRQNQRTSVRIVLDERDNVLKFERGSLIVEATTSVYLVKDDRAIRVPVALGAASVSEIEVLRGLAPGDRVIISDTRDFNEAPELLIAD